MSTLFELTGKYLEVKNLAEEGVDEQVIIDTLESIDDEIEEKADNYAAVIRHLKGNMEMIDAEIERLKKIKGTHANAEKRIKQNLYESMKTIKKSKIKTATNNFYIKKNPPSLKVEKEDHIPDDYFITKRQLDKKSLLQYIKDAEKAGATSDDVIEGVRIEQGESIVIK